MINHNYLMKTPFYFALLWQKGTAAYFYFAAIPFKFKMQTRAELISDPIPVGLLCRVHR